MGMITHNRRFVSLALAKSWQVPTAKIFPIPPDMSGWAFRSQLRMRESAPYQLGSISWATATKLETRLYSPNCDRRRKMW